VLAEAEAYLRATYDPFAPADSKSKWIENTAGLWVYLNHKLIESRGLEVPAVAKTLADYLARQYGIARTFTRGELGHEPDSYDAIGKRTRKAYHPDRSGDVAILLKPYWLAADPQYSTGTSHGTPYPYDTHVPLLVFGANIKPGIRKDEVVPAAIASIFAKALGIAPPAKAEYAVPDRLFRD
jgi:hypothetical protein